MPRILDFLSPWGLCGLLQWLGEPTSLLNSTQKPQEVLLREEKSLTVTGYKVCPEDIPIPLLPGQEELVLNVHRALAEHLRGLFQPWTSGLACPGGHLVP